MADALTATGVQWVGSEPWAYDDFTLRHVLWIGGPPGAGKTTIATYLARRYGVRRYSVDTRTWVHRERALLAQVPAAQRWESLTPVERWEQSSLAEMFEMSLYYERGPMVIDDLRGLPDSPLIIAEGVVLPASAASTGLAERSQMVWLLPTAEFQDAQLSAAETALGPLAGRRSLYRFLREVAEQEARDHEVPVLTVDGSLGVSEMVEAVYQLFSSVLTSGPWAKTLEERQRLLREINQAILDQIRGYYAQSWVDGDPDLLTRSFVCECGNLTCEAEVSRTIQDVLAGPVLARGHEFR